MLLKAPSRVSLCCCESGYSRLAGYEDTIDAQRLSVDPAMRHEAGNLYFSRQI